ncbi:hypothetical protein U1Q18_052355, partial [Sarracenia purpurea var. burkii]
GKAFYYRRSAVGTACLANLALRGTNDYQLKTGRCERITMSSFTVGLGALQKRSDVKRGRQASKKPRCRPSLDKGQEESSAGHNLNGEVMVLLRAKKNTSILENRNGTLSFEYNLDTSSVS